MNANLPRTPLSALVLAAVTASKCLVVAAALATHAPLALAAPGLIGYWSFDEGQGTTAADTSGLGNHGTLHPGATWVEGKVGKALRFNGGADSFVQVPASSSLNVSTGLTISAWVKPEDSEGPHIIVSKWNDPTRQWSYIFKDWNNSDKFSIQISKGIADDLAFLEGSSPIVPGVWTHVTTTFDAATKVVRLYVNGELDSQGVANEGAIHPSPADLLIGAVNLSVDGQSTTESFEGLIDEVAVYDGAISPSDVRQLAVGWLQVTSAPLTENSGTVAVSVKRHNYVQEPARISYTVVGGTATPSADFTLPNGTLEFAAGASTLSFPLTIVDDMSVEGPETIVLSLTNSERGWSVQIPLTITDDDTGIELVAPLVSVPEAAEQVILEVRRVDDSAEPATVEYTTLDGAAQAGVDYLATTGTLTFATGNSCRQIVVPIMADNVLEPDKAFIVQLRNVTGASGQGATASAVVLIEGELKGTHYVALDSPRPISPYTTWDTAATKIQDAVDACDEPGGLVLVTNGVYTTGERAPSFVGEDGGNILLSPTRVVIDKPITVQSVNGPAVTVIQGGRQVFDAEGNITEDNRKRCVFLGPKAIVSGFTLTNGVASGIPGNDSALVDGGGAYLAAGGILTNCMVVGCGARVGGGVYGGAIYNTTVRHNYSRRLGVSYEGGGGAARSTLIGCHLDGNRAEGVFCRDFCVPSGLGGGAFECLLYNCRITGNSAGARGGGAFTSILYNCWVTGNSAGLGGGGGAVDSLLMNCTVVGNTADVGAGVVGATLYDCVVYFNAAVHGDTRFDNYASYYGDCTFFNSCTTPKPPGPGNTSANPLFVSRMVDTTHLTDPDGNPLPISWTTNDLRLQPGSPCIDTGTNLVGLAWTNANTGEIFVFTASPGFLASPLDGNGDGVAVYDMGAHEFDPRVPYFGPILQPALHGFRLMLRGLAETSVRLERSADLQTWEPWMTVVMPTSEVQVIDPQELTTGQQFYRAVLEP